jgi:tryptophanyl-tRNA synthetase|tara:strand:- start:65 stop:268 length:204 start_codon:yes stop_codon:yes gene_type:complete
MMGDVTDIRKQAVAAEKSGEFFVELDTLVTTYLAEGLDIAQIVLYLQLLNVSLVADLASAIYCEEDD